MRATFLGTGTSVGIPIIGCACPTCASSDPRNRRRRCSMYVEADGFHLLIDTSPDLHAQALAFGVPRVDAVVITHPHADHINGFDDLRVFGSRSGRAIPVHADAFTVERLLRNFDYVVETPVPGAHLPLIRYHELTPPPLAIGPFTLDWFRVEHGPIHSNALVLEHRGRRLAYIPDCKRLDADGLRRLAGVETLILDALRDTPHASHLTLAESLACISAIRPGAAWLTHLGHELEHVATTARLPDGVSIAFDGLSLEC